MPDLHYIAVRYLEGRYGVEGDVEGHEAAVALTVDSPAQLFNVAMRSWGHLYLYDLAELTLRLNQAGFSVIEPQRLGESSHPELSLLEQRAESRLIVEATR
jgi:predicted SAM-dependent methyltransferase